MYLCRHLWIFIYLEILYNQNIFLEVFHICNTNFTFESIYIYSNVNAQSNTQFSRFFEIKSRIAFIPLFFKIEFFFHSTKIKSQKLFIPSTFNNFLQIIQSKKISCHAVPVQLGATPPRKRQ